MPKIEDETMINKLLEMNIWFVCPLIIIDNPGRLKEVDTQENIEKLRGFLKNVVDCDYAYIYCLTSSEIDQDGKQNSNGLDVLIGGKIIDSSRYWITEDFNFSLSPLEKKMLIDAYFQFQKNNSGKIIVSEPKSNDYYDSDKLSIINQTYNKIESKYPDTSKIKRFKQILSHKLIS